MNSDLDHFAPLLSSYQGLLIRCSTRASLRLITPGRRQRPVVIGKVFIYTFEGSALVNAPVVPFIA